MELAYEETIALKKHLKRAWTPFFSRFGILRPTQIAAIPHVLAGKNVVLSSSTGSGKTEAILAPLAERLVQHSRDSLLAIYIAPTRALVNDIEKRCRSPLEEMGFACRVRTGDRREFNERHPSQFLVTTPESLDSMLTRIPSLFRTVQAVTIDELHLIDKTYRGDQLRILLSRLSNLTGATLQICIASATMDNIDAMAKRYAPSPIIIDIGGDRDIDEHYFSSLSAITDFLIQRAQALKKILVFANSRKRCEEVASEFRQLLPNWPIMVHHGSLASKEREEVEAAMQANSRWICCATMTLEVGIDISDIDAVSLVEPPWSVASLLQRIGRANRRARSATVLTLFEGVDQRLMYEEQFARARKGLLDRQAYRPDLSVVVQQVFSMLSGSPGGLADAELRDPFRDFCSQEELEGILRHLVKGRHISERYGRWFASAEIMDLAESGRVYSNIQDSFSRRVVDGRNGQQVGEVNDVIDNNFMLAGRTWKVTRFEGNTIVVEPTTVQAGMPIFQVHSELGAFARYLPDAFRMRSARPL